MALRFLTAGESHGPALVAILIPNGGGLILLGALTLATTLLRLVLPLAWLRSVRGYTVEGGQVVVNRAGPGRVNIAIADIDEKAAESVRSRGASLPVRAPCSSRSATGAS